MTDIKEEKELNILRNAVLLGESIKNKNLIKSPQLIKTIRILVDFLKKKELLCYGGTAINNILPKEDQFYNFDVEIPDFDFYSPNALNDAIELSKIYYLNGFEEVEAKAGMHKGTFKVFVNFIPIADITYIPESLFNNLKKDSKVKNGIFYTPVEFLRMSMYLELSRPEGDISRWEKVLKRLFLLNKVYPLKYKICPNIFNFESVLEDKKNRKIVNILKDALIEDQVVFFGGFSLNLLSKYATKKQKTNIENLHTFDVLSVTPFSTLMVIMNTFKLLNFKNIKYIKHPQLEDLIGEHYQLYIDNIHFLTIYKPLSCNSYNEIIYKGKKIKVATTETILSLYLLFMFTGHPYFDKNKMLCFAEYVFRIQQKYRLRKKGILKRYNINCYGKQLTFEKIKEIKSNKFKTLKHNKKSKEYKEWFLRYIPNNQNIKVKSKTKSKSKSKSKPKTKRKPKSKPKSKSRSKTRSNKK